MTPGPADKARKGEGPPPDRARLRLAAVGMEAEFQLVVDEREVRPEDVFGDPRGFIVAPLVHRTGTSYHLPTGGAIYFDTGVVELATPVIELERGCAARAGRSLWESLRFVRDQLDGWETRERRRARLVGFSAHYNVSFELPPASQGRRRTVEKLACLLAHVLPVPVLLLAANRRSTGIGVRPRGDRIEVTADYTPSPELLIATATLVVGITREVMRWPSFELGELEEHGVPVVEGFRPIRHTSRRGWLAHLTSFPRNPFRSDIDRDLWRTTSGEDLTLRALGARVTRIFWPGVRRLSDPFTFRLIRSVMRGRAPSLLDLPDRPPDYEDVGRAHDWDDLFPERQLVRSRYERVVIHAIAGHRLRLRGRWLRPVGMRGWSQVVFRREDGQGREVVPLDELVAHLDDWRER